MIAEKEADKPADPSCKKCHGAGWTYVPMFYGEEWAKTCECRYEKPKNIYEAKRKATNILEEEKGSI